MNSEILVIIVTFNGMQWIERCISSVRESSLSADILVIDNGSTDGTPEWLQSHGVDVIRNSSNTGFGAANNIGLMRAVEEGYSYAYLLNQDAWVGRDCFATLERAFSTDGRFGILSPMQYDGGGKKLEKQFAKRCKSRIKKHKGETIVEVPFVMAAHWMISRGCLMKVGGFSPAFHHYGEDNDYVNRVHWWGFRCGVVPEAPAVHDRAQRKETHERRMFLKCNVGVAHICNPKGGLLLRMLGEPLRLVALGCRNFDGAPFRYIGTLVKRYPELIRLRKRSRKAMAFLG